MKLSNILLVFKKEMMDTIRDRRTLFVMIILPILLYPLMIIGMSQLTAMQARKIRSQKMLIGLASPLPGALRQALLKHEKLDIYDTEWNTLDHFTEEKTFIVGYQNRQLQLFHLDKVQSFEPYTLPDPLGKEYPHDSAILFVRQKPDGSGFLSIDRAGVLCCWKEGKLLQKITLNGAPEDFLWVPGSLNFWVAGQHLQEYHWENDRYVLKRQLRYPEAKLTCMVLDQNRLHIGTSKGTLFSLSLNEEKLEILHSIPPPLTSSPQTPTPEFPALPPLHKSEYPVQDLALSQGRLWCAYKNQIFSTAFNNTASSPQDSPYLPSSYHTLELPFTVQRLIPIDSFLYAVLHTGDLVLIDIKRMVGKKSRYQGTPLTRFKNQLVDVCQRENFFYALAWSGLLYEFEITPTQGLRPIRSIEATYTEENSQKIDFEKLRKNELQLILEIPPHFQEDIEKAENTARLLVHYYGANDQHRTAIENLKEAIEKYSDRIVLERLQYKLGQEPEFAEPVKLYNKNAASELERGAFHIGKMIAMLIVLMTITCPFYPAIDLAAGEKERGTMETLLVSPLDRREIVLGKYLTVITVSLFAALLNLGSMALTFTYFADIINNLHQARVDSFAPEQEKVDEAWTIKNNRMSFQITGQQIFIIFCLLLPLTGLFSAVSLALSAFAKSYKEGQYYLTPLFAVATPLAMVGMLPNVELNTPLSLVPIMNVVLLFKELFIGQFIWSHILLALGSTAFFCIIAIYWTVGVFQKEEVLFRRSEDINLKFWIPVGPARKTPLRSQAFFLFALSLILYFFLGQRLQQKWQLYGVIASQLLFLVLPTIYLIQSAKMSFKETLSLKPFKWTAIPLVLLLMISCFFITLWLNGLTSKLLPESSLELKQLEQSFEFLLKNTPWFIILLAVGVTPGICEEILCRGFLLSGFSENQKKGQGVLLVGICFGVLHLYPARYLTTGFMGIILALIVLRTGSIFPAMIAHIFNNSTIGAIGTLIPQDSSLAKNLIEFFNHYAQAENVLTWNYAFIYLLPASIVTLLCLYGLSKPQSLQSSEEA
jgi:sodium transport system permease protein